METEVFPFTYSLLIVFNLSLRCYSCTFSCVWLAQTPNRWNILSIQHKLFCDEWCTFSYIIFPFVKFVWMNSLNWSKYWQTLLAWTSSMVWIHLLYLKWQFYLVFNRLTFRCNKKNLYLQLCKISPEIHLSRCFW